MKVKTKRAAFVPHPAHFRRLLLGLSVAWGLSQALLACRTRPLVANQGPAPLLIELERTACMGPCPVDVLTVYADGRLRYQGQANAPRQGSYAGQLTGREQAELVQAFDEARFFNFAPAYVADVSDLPTYFLTYVRDGQRLKITDYAGAPPALKALEARLTRLIDANRWRPQ